MSERSTNRVGPALLDSFIPHPDVRERHEIVINAPAALVFEVARNLDMQSISAVRAIFWLRAKALGANTNVPGPRRLIGDMLSIGWARLARPVFCRRRAITAPEIFTITIPGCLICSTI
jgi:hypothetical protein